MVEVVLIAWCIVNTILIAKVAKSLLIVITTVQEMCDFMADEGD